MVRPEGFPVLAPTAAPAPRLGRFTRRSERGRAAGPQVLHILHSGRCHPRPGGAWHASCFDASAREAMVMLSDLLRCRVVAAGWPPARLVDVAVDPEDGEYPPVTHVLLRGSGGSGGDPVVLPWPAPAEIDLRHRLLVVASTGAPAGGGAAGGPGAGAAPAGGVLLRRDVLDAMLIDVANRQTTRANDLWLEPEAGDGRLHLAAADISPEAVLRRVTRGRLWAAGRRPSRNLLDWRDAEFLRGDPLGVRSGRAYERRISRLPPAEIARLLDGLPYLHAAELLLLLPPAAGADTLEAMSPERQMQVFGEVEDADAALATELLGRMAPNAAADLLGRLPAAEVGRWLGRLPEATRRRVLELLRYPEDTAGGIMTNDVVVAPAGLTVAEARVALAGPLRDPDFVYYVYVVDAPETRRLRGVVTLRELLIAPGAARLDAVMRPHLVAVRPDEPATVAAQRVADHSLAALPVVDGEERLVGAVTADAVIAVLAPPAWRNLAPRVFS